MLDPNALAKLGQLKSDIQSSKDYAEGTVAATSGRFGFVRTDDGRDAFLAPEKMDRVFPGDRVKVSITENDKGKLEAEFEKLLSSDIKKFVGQYRVRGAGHFVVPGGTQFSRWIFVPPAQRKGAKEGDYVIAKVARHPYRDGKAQANIIFLVGQPNDAFIEHKYTKAKYELNYRSAEDHETQIKAIQDYMDAADFGLRDDLSDKKFVTIDSESTLDMDDALAIEETDQGFTLYVAIADPSSSIAPESALAKQAKNCGQSVYLIGGAVPMLPINLAHHAFSLEENKTRPVIICELSIDAQGEVLGQRFYPGTIASKHKLSYSQVAQFLDDANADAVPEDVRDELTRLRQLALARRSYRDTHYLVSEDHLDFDFNLDSQGQIENIIRRERNSAQLVVEEAMIACNIAAGEFLNEHKCGLHSIHKGFREDRIGEVNALLKEEGMSRENINTLEGHISLLKALQNDTEKLRLIPALRRMMVASELSFTSAPHMGLGVPTYATITSPIRRFADLYNHWCLIAILAKNDIPALNDETLVELNDTLRNGRQADRELQQWLICQYTHKNLLGKVFDGKVRITTQQGMGVKLVDTGIEGFILFGKKIEKSFDAKRMTLTVNDHTYWIDDSVKIKVVSVDMDKRRIAFELA